MPTPTPFARELTVALDAVREAARLCGEVQRSLAGAAMQKDDRSPVTVADFGSQALVCRRLAEAFPSDPIIAEESAKALAEPENQGLLANVVSHVQRVIPTAGAEDVRRWIDHGGAAAYALRYWTLDPIDGTKGFLRHDQYAVALALVIDGQLAVAALACPNLLVGGSGAIFTAIAGHGALLTNMDGAAPIACRVSDTGDAAAMRFCESFESGHSSHDASAAAAKLLGVTAAPIRMDSQAKYGVVARGQADAYLRLPKAGYVENIWDHAAGALVVTEAGGRVTDLHGRPLEFTHGRRLEHNRGVIVTNGRLHDRVLEALAQAGAN